MGQYWLPVNLTKGEFFHPYRVGSGLKAWEMMAAHPGVGAGLVLLTVAAPDGERGGGDLAVQNLRDNVPEWYQKTARETIGRWAGDQIAIVGDYAEDEDLENNPCDVKVSDIYDACCNDRFTDISKQVAQVIEYELGGKYTTGGGWLDWNWLSELDIDPKGDEAWRLRR